VVTPRLRLEPFGEPFFTERYVSWLNDPEVTRYSEQRHARHTLASCREYVAALPAANGLMWAIVETKEGLGHVGNVNCYVDAVHGVADVGILVGERSVWGKGVASEAFAGVTTFCFSRLGVRKVTAGTIAPNVGMLGVMRKLGMVDDGVRRRHLVWNGEPVDVVHMALFAERWKDPYSSRVPSRDV
jgi:RimJ/RimL family protein N-acetyltransferase